MTTTPTTHAAEPGTQPQPFGDEIRIATGCGRLLPTTATVAAPTCSTCAAMLALRAGRR